MGRGGHRPHQGRVPTAGKKIGFSNPNLDGTRQEGKVRGKGPWPQAGGNMQ